MQRKEPRLVLRGACWYILYPGNSRGKSTRTGDGELAKLALADFVRRRSGNVAERVLVQSVVIDDGTRAPRPIRRQQIIDKGDNVNYGLTVHQAIEDYLVEHARSNIVAKENAEISARYFRTHFSARKRVVDLQESDFISYARKRRKAKIRLLRNPKPAGNGTIRRELGMLAATFRHAARKKRIRQDDVPYIPLPAPPPPRDRWLTREEEDRLIAACPVDEADELARRSAAIRERVQREGFIGPPCAPLQTKPDPRLTRIYRFLMLAIETGARKAALETLTWLQVDFKVGTIDLNPRGRIQTKKKRARVKINAVLRSILQRAYDERRTGFVLDHKGDIRTSFENLVERSGLKDVTPHVLRHTWATRAAQIGVPIREIAGWLGDSIATVERTYFHHHPDFLRAAANWREKEKHLHSRRIH